MELGIVKNIFICASAGGPMQSVPLVRALAQKGLEGDRYAANRGFWQTVSRPRLTIRDVSIIREKDILGSGFSEDETRRNIVIKTDLDLLTLLGSEFRIGEVLFRGIEDCTPCKRPSQLCAKADFEKIFAGKGGLRAHVLTDGLIRVGDQMMGLI